MRFLNMYPPVAPCPAVRWCGAMRLMALFVVTLGITTMASANTFVVTSLADDGGAGTLRAAITAANSNPGDDIITFAAGVRGTINLTSTLPDLSSNIDMRGPGADRLEVRRGTTEGFRIFLVAATVSISRLAIAAGASNQGGGIFNYGSLTLTDCTIRDNSASLAGGGVRTVGTLLTVSGCTFSGNSSSHVGAGIDCTGGAMSIQNSTFSSNTAQGVGDQRVGDAVFVQEASSVLIQNCTFNGGGITANSSSSSNRVNVHVGNCLFANDRSVFTVGATITSLGYNIASDDGAGYLTATGDRINTNPLLDSNGLQDNGGRTPTIALQNGSPAINTGSTSLTTDQRGAPRDARPDRGAFEFGATVSTIAPTVSDITVSTREDTILAFSKTLFDDAFSDPDGDSLAFLQFVSLPQHGTLRVDGSAITTPGTVLLDTLLDSVTYTPAADYSGSDDFTYRASDDELISNTAAIRLTVLSVNDAPTFATVANQTVAEDSGAHTVSLTGVSPDPTNEAGQSVTFMASSSNPALIPPPTITGSGTTRTLSYTPGANASGTATITVTATDSGGTGNGGVNTFSRTFTINVTAVNDAPTANAGPDQNVTTAETSAPVLLSGSGSDIDGDTLTFRWLEGGQQIAAGANPTVTLSIGVHTLTLEARDPGGLTGTDTVTITVTQTAPAPAQNVTGQVSVTLGALRVDRATGRSIQPATLTNTGSGAIAGPISLVLDSLSAGVTLSNRDGVTSAAAPAGSPYKNTGGGLAAGQSVSLTLEFTKTGNPIITFTPRVLAGPGAR